MKKLSIILACFLAATISCTKSKEVHPEIGDGNDEIVTVGMTDVHVEYIRTDHAEINKVVFHYCPANANGNAQQFAATEMTKKETFFELTLNDLLSDTLYWYYYELFYNGGNTSNTLQKTFHTQTFEEPEPPTPPVAELPTVITAEVSEMTGNSAQCGGEVTNDGGSEVTERGICWSTDTNPTISDSHVSVGSGVGVFSSTISGLLTTTTYHIRAYAINETGTAYGEDKEFTTLSGGGSGAPEGAINGLFTINENGDQVYFSQGNLQYQASTNTWRFAEHQWNYVGTQTPDWSSGLSGGNVVGSDNNYISESYDGWIDLFGWGTSGYNHGAVCYQPWSISGSIHDYCPYGSNTTSLYDGSGQADWGYNSISNGGNQEGLWRTMKMQEWDYVLNNRNTESGIRYVKAKVNNEGGLLLLPDAWDVSLYDFNGVNQGDASFNSNIIPIHVWENILQSNGAIFLPMAGDRIINLETGECNVTAYVGGYGLYWTSNLSTTGSYRALLLLFSDDSVDLDSRPTEVFFGFSVRLVQDAN